jgi:hypothetical protein
MLIAAVPLFQTQFGGLAFYLRVVKDSKSDFHRRMRETTASRYPC